MRKYVSVALSALVVLVFGGMAFSYAAQDVGSAGRSGTPAVMGGMSQPAGASEEYAGSFRHQRSLKAIMEKLGITDEQKKQFRSLYVGFSDRTRKARTELMGLKDEKKTMLLSGKIDQQKLAQIDDQLVKVKTDLLKEKLKFKRERLALLNPQQLDKVADWMAEMSFRSKFNKMRGGGMMHGGGMMGSGGKMGGGCMMRGGGGMSD
jgi:Spy/CpxP family protein refolding chaperone